MSKVQRLQTWGAVLILLSVLLVDQSIKWYVKTTMCLHESIHIFDWFYILFTENDGMAFGWDFIGTVFLSTFRLFAIVLLVWYIVKMIKAKSPSGLIVCLALILAGAVGNLIDNAFYGLFFSESLPFLPAKLVSLGEGYAPFMGGHVVDMFYFPIIDTVWPDFVPFLGGKHFIFFSPVFNFADSAISCGGVSLILFYRQRLVMDNGPKQSNPEK